jgi:hypothetical protein
MTIPVKSFTESKFPHNFAQKPLVDKFEMHEEHIMPKVKIMKVRGKRNGRSAPGKSICAVPTPLKSSNRQKAEITPF